MCFLAFFFFPRKLGSFWNHSYRLMGWEKAEENRHSQGGGGGGDGLGREP